MGEPSPSDWAVPADRPPFEDIYREFLGRIYAYVRAQVMSSADAEDITAQALMNAYQAYPRLETRNTTPPAGLFRIARNATIHHFLAHSRRERLQRSVAHQPIELPQPAVNTDESL